MTTILDEANRITLAPGERAALTINPFCALLPWVPDEELREWAESIKEDGLHRSVIIRRKDNGETEVIDGKLRLRACKFAGVEPTFLEFEGDDEEVKALIVDMNIHRMHHSKSQKAMMRAMSSKPRDGESDHVRRARDVLAYSEALAESVMYGVTGLGEAMAEVEQARREAAMLASLTDRLKHNDADMYEAYVEDHMSLEEAINAAIERREAHEKRRKHARDTLRKLQKLVNDLPNIAEGLRLSPDPLLSEQLVEEFGNAYRELVRLSETANRALPSPAPMLQIGGPQ